MSDGVELVLQSESGLTAETEHGHRGEETGRGLQIQSQLLHGESVSRRLPRVLYHLVPMCLRNESHETAIDARIGVNRENIFPGMRIQIG